MTWLQRYRLRHFLRVSFWYVPVVWIVAAVVAVPAMRWLDQQTGWSWFNFTPEGARGILTGSASSMLTFVVFAVSTLLLAVQLAASQLTPRIINFIFSLRKVQVSVGVFVFAYAFTLGALGRIEAQHVPQLLVFVAVLSSLISIGLFLWFVPEVSANLQPVAVLRHMWEQGRLVIDSVYPGGVFLVNPPAAAMEVEAPCDPSRIIEHVGGSGTFIAFGVKELVAAAQSSDVVIELVPQVGDFVSPRDPLFRIYPADRHIDEAALHQMVAIGRSRTLEQDPAFAFRIMVDIASRALSPAVNDPTTAVLALDQIQCLLGYVGEKQLNVGREFDTQGKLRLIYRMPQWEDFAALAVTEVRLFGAASIQVARRLRAMLEHLIAVLPEARAPALRQELASLQSAVERNYADAEDQRRAQTGDRQGIGGSSTRRPGV
jgi:uncharacterized membrane protein